MACNNSKVFEGQSISWKLDDVARFLSAEIYFKNGIHEIEKSRCSDTDHGRRDRFPQEARDSCGHPVQRIKQVISPKARAVVATDWDRRTIANSKYVARRK